MRRLNPCMDRFACRLGDLELHRAFRLLLRDNAARGDLIAVGDVQHPKLHEIAGAEFRIDSEIEEGGVPGAVPQSQADPDRPDVAQPQGRLLADELAFVPGLSLLGLHRSPLSGLRWCAAEPYVGAKA